MFSGTLLISHYALRVRARGISTAHLGGGLVQRLLGSVCGSRPLVRRAQQFLLLTIGCVFHDKCFQGRARQGGIYFGVGISCGDGFAGIFIVIIWRQVLRHFVCNSVLCDLVNYINSIQGARWVVQINYIHTGVLCCCCIAFICLRAHGCFARESCKLKFNNLL